jgi:hypothetical protein
VYLSAANQQIDNLGGYNNTATQAKYHLHFKIGSQKFCFSTIEIYRVLSYKNHGKTK